jgi:hypothetical protein
MSTADLVFKMIERAGGLCSFQHLKDRLPSHDPKYLRHAISLLEEEGRIRILMDGTTPLYASAAVLERVR